MQQDDGAPPLPPPPDGRRKPIDDTPTGRWRRRSDHERLSRAELAFVLLVQSVAIVVAAWVVAWVLTNAR